MLLFPLSHCKTHTNLHKTVDNNMCMHTEKWYKRTATFIHQSTVTDPPPCAASFLFYVCVCWSNLMLHSVAMMLKVFNHNSQARPWPQRKSETSWNDMCSQLFHFISTHACANAHTSQQTYILFVFVRLSRLSLSHTRRARDSS